MSEAGRARPPVVVGIATIPSRIARIKPTLDSLLAGELVPDLILVNTPHFCKLENSGYEIPPFLADPTVFGGKVRHAWCAADWGPGTKILGPVPHLPPESILVIADDDILYHRSFLKLLVDAQAKDRDKSYSFYGQRLYGLQIGQGCDGLSVWSPHLDGIEAFAHKFVAGTTLLYHDDLWIASFLATKGVMIRKLPPPPGTEIVYEQVLPNNVLALQAGEMKRYRIMKTQLPRLLDRIDLSPGQRVRMRVLSAYDGVVHFPRRVVDKVKRVTGSRNGGLA